MTDLERALQAGGVVKETQQEPMTDLQRAMQAGGQIVGQPTRLPSRNPASELSAEPTDPAWAGKFPTAYGVYGAGKETAKAVGEFFGVDKITDPMARIAAHTMAKSNAERAGVGTPSAGELAQAAAYTGALAMPYGKVASGVSGVVSKVLPKAGPYIGEAVSGGLGGYLYDAGNKLAKDEVPTPGAATAIGAILPPGAAVIGKAGKGTYEYLTKKEPARIINSLIKPLLKDFNFAKNPGRVLAEEGMVANSFDDLVSKISQKRPEIGKKLEVVASTLDRMAKGKKAATIDVSSALTPIDDAMAEAAKQNNQTLIDRLVKAKNAITKNLALGVDENGAQTIVEVGKKNLTSLGFNDAIGIKREIGSLTKWTDNASDDKTINAALKQTYGSIRGIIESKADELHPGLASQFRKLNEKYADITSAEIAAKYRDKIIERHDLMSLKSHTGLATGTILAAVSTGGAGLPVVLAGLGGAALDKVLGSTAVKTRVATWLAKAATQDKNILYRKAPKLAAAINKAFGIKGLQFPGDMAFQDRNLPSSAMADLKRAGETLRDTTLTGQSSSFQPKLAKSPLTRVGTSVGSMSDEAASELVSQTRRANAVEAFKNVPPNKAAIESAQELVKAPDSYPPQGVDIKALPGSRYEAGVGSFKTKSGTPYSKQVVLSPVDINNLNKSYPSVKSAQQMANIFQRKGKMVYPLREATKKGSWKLSEITGGEPTNISPVGEGTPPIVFTYNPETGALTKPVATPAAEALPKAETVVPSKPIKKAEVKKETPAKAEAVTPPVEKAKEPWEMTREKFVADWKQGIPEGQKISKGLEDSFVENHRLAVKRAFDKGLPVPDSVLADYPELQATPPVEKAKAIQEAKKPLSLNEKGVMGALYLDKDNPYEMSIKDYYKTREELKAKGFISEKEDGTHALTAQGKSLISAEVLKDYPELQATPPVEKVSSVAEVKPKVKKKEAISDSGIETLFDAGRFEDFLKFTEALTPEQKKKYEAAISIAKHKVEYKPPVEQPAKIDRELVDAIKKGDAWVADNVDIWNTPEGEIARAELEKGGEWWGIAKKAAKPKEGMKPK